MSKMFRNYDNPHNCCMCDCIHVEKPAIMLGWSGMEIIYDEKGNEVGLGFNQGSPITLTFSIDGCILDDFGDEIEVDYFINNNQIKFELLDFRYRQIYENTVDGAVEDGVMIFSINQEIIEKLVPEIYYIKLTLVTDGCDYVLFTPHDGLIHIL